MTPTRATAPTPVHGEFFAAWAIARLRRVDPFRPFHTDNIHRRMAWALWEIEDCGGALASMQRMKTLRHSAQRMMAGIYACLGDVEKAQAACKALHTEARKPTISEQREEWTDLWTGPGSLDRWLDHMRLAGMKDRT